MLDCKLIRADELSVGHSIVRNVGETTYELMEVYKVKHEPFDGFIDVVANVRDKEGSFRYRDDRLLMVVGESIGDKLISYEVELDIKPDHLFNELCEDIKAILSRNTLLVTYGEPLTSSVMLNEVIASVHSIDSIGDSSMKVTIKVLDIPLSKTILNNGTIKASKLKLHSMKYYSGTTLAHVAPICLYLDNPNL